MKIVKQIDLSISIMLIAGFSIYCIYDPEIAFPAYFIVGGWQVISMLVHVFAGWFTEKNSVRRVYHWFTFIVIAMGCLTSVVYIFGIVFFIMLFAAPICAIIYCLICYNELKSMEKRPLADFK